MSMKYITSVNNKDYRATDHIIDCGSGNVTVREKSSTHPNGMPEPTFEANGVSINCWLRVSTTGNSYYDLSTIVLAVEQVRFVLESTDRKVGCR